MLTLLFGAVLAISPLSAISPPTEHPACETVGIRGQCSKSAKDSKTSAKTVKNPGRKKTGSSSWPPAGCEVVRDAYIPPVGEGAWNGHTDGTLTYYDCGRAALGTVDNGFFIWTPPGAAVDINTVVRDAIARLQIRAIDIGMVPEQGSDTNGNDKIGLVGLPTWMWIDNPLATTAGPISKVDTDSGLAVTLNATLQQVTWTMGDGTTVTCAGTAAKGTTYRNADAASASPTCGHTYRKPGTYTITATSHWQIDWTAAGTAGTETLDLTATTTRTIGEMQVIVTN